jgi:microcystin-dependent protein
MAKTKISEFDVDPSNNTDINSINIAEGCAPSGINNAIRQLMSDLKEFQTGAADDNFTVGGNFVVDGSATFATAPIITAGGGIIPTGGIIIWSGAANAIPSGWLLCNGSNGTPDLRNRFVVGAGAVYSVGGTGGTADSVVVAHTHSATSSVSDPGHNHTAVVRVGGGGPANDWGAMAGGEVSRITATTNGSGTGISVSTSIGTTGSSATNANLPPYYALCYIMKA